MLFTRSPEGSSSASGGEAANAVDEPGGVRKGVLVAHRVLRPESRDVKDITVDEVEAAYASLAAEVSAQHSASAPSR